MIEQQAYSKGLHFTGIYSSNKEEVKNRIKQEQELYPKARIVLVNVLHSGSNMGYSIYV